jgi:ABC-type transport system involved in multi-copper enzyme maturation permease subunit
VAARPPRGGTVNNILAIAGVVIKEMYRRKDFYVLLIITVLITSIMGSVTLFHDDKIVRYLKSLCLLLIWISSLVIAITTVARQIPAEKESRTIFPLLAKPVSRNQLLLGKFLGCWLASGIALACFYGFFALFCLAKAHDLPVLTYAQAATLHWFMLAALIAMALLGSLVFAAPSSNGTICLVVTIGILSMGRYLHKVAAALPEPRRAVLTAIYFIIPHFEIYDLRGLLVHDWPPVDWGVYSIAVAWILAYSALLLAASCLIFRRKPLS